MRELGTDKFQTEWIKTIRVQDTDELRKEEAKELLKHGVDFERRVPEDNCYNQRVPHRDFSVPKKYCSCCKMWITTQHFKRHTRSKAHIRMLE